MNIWFQQCGNSSTWGNTFAGKHGCFSLCICVTFISREGGSVPLGQLCLLSSAATPSEVTLCLSVHGEEPPPGSRQCDRNLPPALLLFALNRRAAPPKLLGLGRSLPRSGTHQEQVTGPVASGRVMCPVSREQTSGPGSWGFEGVSLLLMDLLNFGDKEQDVSSFNVRGSRLFIFSG